MLVSQPALPCPDPHFQDELSHTASCSLPFAAMSKGMGQFSCFLVFSFSSPTSTSSGQLYYVTQAGHRGHSPKCCCRREAVLALPLLGPQNQLLHKLQALVGWRRHPTPAHVATGQVRNQDNNSMFTLYGLVYLYLGQWCWFYCGVHTMNRASSLSAAAGGMPGKLSIHLISEPALLPASGVDGQEQGALSPLCIQTHDFQ